MSFSTYSFVFIFLPIVVLLYFIVPKEKKHKKKFQQIIMIIASCVFVVCDGMVSVVVLSCSIIVNFFLIKKILIKKKNKVILLAGYVFNISLLCLFKYLVRNIAWPLGLSFITFQQMLYLQGEYKQNSLKNERHIENFGEYLEMILFFPKIISGPIIQHRDSVKQFKKENRGDIDFNNIATGYYLFCIGLFKKVVLADTLALFVDTGFGMVNELNVWQAWMTSISYTFQIYFDFSGYSDMAVGIARMFNVCLPVNFNSPYHSKSIKEFWNRWHITLGNTLAQLVYFPLGGNRKGTIRTCINKFIVFAISGLWHGSGWNFILWGICYGILSVIEVVFNSFLERISKHVRIIVCFFLVNILWVLFKAQSIEQAFAFYGAMFGSMNTNWTSIGILAYDGIIPFPNIVWALYLIGVLVISGIIIFKKENSMRMCEKFVPNWRNVIFSSFLFCISVLHMSRLSIFVYQNF